MQRPRRPGDAKTTWLADHPWWGELREDDLAQIAALGDRLELPADRLLMHRGQAGVEAAMIIDGEVVVSRFGQVLAWLGPGEIVGSCRSSTGCHATPTFARRPTCSCSSSPRRACERRWRTSLRCGAG